MQDTWPRLTRVGSMLSQCWPALVTLEQHWDDVTSNVGSMLAQRLRRWFNIDPTLDYYL